MNQIQNNLVSPLNTILNPSSWNDPSWLYYLNELKLDKSRMVRKIWEFTQTVYGLDKLGYLKEENIALDVGAGTERPLFYLANRLKKVIGFDLYDFDCNHRSTWHKPLCIFGGFLLF